MSCEDWLEQVARASGIETPTREDLAKMGRTRPKKGSNEDWVRPHDPDVPITKLTDGRTRLPHKFEQAVDMETGAVVTVTVQTTGWRGHGVPAGNAGRGGAAAGGDGGGAQRSGGGEGLPLEQDDDRGARPRAAELRERAHSRGPRKGRGKRDARKPTYANRRRIRGNRRKRLLRQRDERLEWGFAHLLVTGGLRRVHVRGQKEIRKKRMADSGCHLPTSGF